MTNKQYVVVNGRAYNSTTGLPMDDIRVSPAPSRAAAQTSRRGAAVSAVHTAATQRSNTLSRRHVKQPRHTPLAARPHKTRIAVARHSAVHKFTPNSTQTPTPISQRVDRPAETHPLVHRAKARTTPTKTSTIRNLQDTPQATTTTQPLAIKPARELKRDAITEALAKEMTDNKKHHMPQKHKKLSRLTSILSVGLAVMLLGGYFTYLSMPNISIRVAAIQSGVNAKYPGYKPDGYALNGPITFKDGEVSMKYAYADGGAAYTLTQQKSSWDSAAVKEYFSEKASSPTATIVDGLTIYSSGKEAVWVNGGTLYQISGNANLSNEQLQKIATSL